jgi:hypothetical protein
MTIHPVGATAGKVQTLLAKENEWKLLINEEGKLEWHVHVLSGWLITTGTRVLKPVRESAEAYVIKASKHAFPWPTCPALYACLPACLPVCLSVCLSV